MGVRLVMVRLKKPGEADIDVLGREASETCC